MDDKIEQIIDKIEQSFTSLNTSVDLLKKAEEITTAATETTSSLINEFETTITSIEKLVKTDFANEYNKLVKVQQSLITKIDKIDFDKKFDATKAEIAKKNFNKEFESIKSLVDKKEYDERFKEIFDFVLANNEILDSFQNTIVNLPGGFTKIEDKIGSKNFSEDFELVTRLILSKNFNSDFRNIEDGIKDLGSALKDILASNHEQLSVQLNKQNVELRGLKTIMIIVCGLVFAGMLLQIIF